MISQLLGVVGLCCVFGFVLYLFIEVCNTIDEVKRISKTVNHMKNQMNGVVDMCLKIKKNTMKEKK